MAVAGRPLAECQAQCCARDWCKSIDFGRPADGNPDSPGTCVLADMDATNQYGRTGPNPAYDLYERHHLAAVQPALGPSGCSADLASISEAVNAACCGEAGCENNAPQTCSAECSEKWMPFAKKCSEWVRQQAQNGNLNTRDAMTPLIAVTTKCERAEYGKYRAGASPNHHGPPRVSINVAEAESRAARVPRLEPRPML